MSKRQRPTFIKRSAPVAFLLINSNIIKGPNMKSLSNTVLSVSTKAVTLSTQNQRANRALMPCRLPRQERS